MKMLRKEEISLSILGSRTMHNRMSLKYVRNLSVSIVRSLLLIGLIFTILYPMLNYISLAFMPYSDMQDATVQYIPRNPTFGNFRMVWQYLDYLKTLGFTVGNTILVATLQTISCTLIAYGLARFNFRGNKVLFILSLLTLIIPPQTMLIPIYIRFKSFNILHMFQLSGIFQGVSLVNTSIPAILLATTGLAFKSGLYIYILRQFFINMPMVLEEAAHIDGCSTFQTFYRIMIPNAIPMIVTVFLFSFVLQWNDYYYSNILAPDLPTIGMKIVEYINYLNINKATSLLAISHAPSFFLMLLPLIILYIFTQRFFVESITSSGIVG